MTADALTDPWARPAAPIPAGDPAAPFLTAIPAQRAHRTGPRDETDLEHRAEWGRAGDEDAALTRYERHIGH